MTSTSLCTCNTFTPCPIHAASNILNARYRGSVFFTHTKLLVIGHARHGKDTFCENAAPLTYKSSSMAALELFLYRELQIVYGFNYKSVREAYEDRVNYRELWHNAIWNYNIDNPSQLAEDILEESNIYCGMRKLEELQACKEKGLFDLIIWVDASKRLPPESTDSMDITIDDADIVITNNGTEAEFIVKVRKLIQLLIRG